MAICLLIIYMKIVLQGLNTLIAAFILTLETLRRLIIGDRIQFCHNSLLNINDCITSATFPSKFQHGKDKNV
jgi:hypothetical protein